jgi:hypothetical protein
VPAPQSVQTEAPVAAEYLPAAQLVQTEAPAAEYVPASQSVQAAELVCAVKPENLPATQLPQSVALVFASEPENLPAGQSVHADEPDVASLYLPASHAVHVPPLGPVYPALHAQSSLVSLAAFSCTQMHTRKITQADTHA